MKADARMMRRRIFARVPRRPRAAWAALLVAALLLLAGPAVAAPSWTGSWDTRWRGGGAVLDLRQEGDRVTGEYPLYGGRIEAEARGRELHGRWIEGDRFGRFLFVLSDDGRSFMGRYDSGEWWTGGRVESGTARVPVDQATPRRAMRTFLAALNRARAGDVEAWGAAAAVLDFGEDARLRPGPRLARARQFAEAVDLATFRLWSVPGRSAEGDAVEVRLPQAGTSEGLAVAFRRAGDRWFLVLPPEEEVAARIRAMRAARGGAASEGHLGLRSPRDVFLTLLDADATDVQRLAAFDLSAVPEAVRAHEGRLATEYLRQVLARIGPVLPQEVPDDPAYPQPYLHFEHPAGRVLLARESGASPPRWQVSRETVAALRGLYTAFERMPPDPEAAQAAPEPSGFFALRRWIGGRAPGLLAPLAGGALEAWQILGILLAVAAGWALGWLAGWPVARIFGWLASQPWAEARRMRWPARLAAASGLWLAGSHWLGLPDLVQGGLLAVFSITLAAAGVWAGWLLADAVAARLHRLAQQTATPLDEIMVSLLAGAAKAGLAVAGLLYVATTLSIPFAGIVAGLGVGGIAFAFASRETLQNVFGAGILLADRPFRQGDSIVAGEVKGTVEKVGIRSTRVRTAEDSLVVVPNGKLADATINNMGTRRHRVVTGRVAAGWATPDQVDALVEGVRGALEARPDVIAGKTAVGAAGLGAEGIEVEFTAALAVPGAAEERDARHAILREVLALAHRLELPSRGAEPAPRRGPRLVGAG